MTDRVSIQTQLSHLNWLCNLADRFEPEAIRRGLATARESELRVRYTSALQATLRWLVQNEARIRQYLAHGQEIDRLLAMEPTVRAAILAHGPEVAAMAVDRAERLARSQGLGQPPSSVRDAAPDPATRATAPGQHP